jgi:MFS family permease
MEKGPINSYTEDDFTTPLVARDGFEEQRRRRYIIIARRAVALICAMIIGLQSGTTNAFNTIASHIQNDTGLGDNLMTLLSSLGIIGLFFTFPAGYVNDRFGAMWTGLIGAVLTSAGYAGMSFTDKESYAAMLICLMLVGFGSGTSFLAALSTGLKTIPGYPGLGIAMVGACMSLSLALTNGIVEFYKNVFDCSADSCWPYYLRSLAVSTAIFLFVPSFGLSLLPPDEPAPAPIQEEEFGVSEDTLPPVSSSSKADLIHQDLIDGRHNTPVSLFYSLHTMRNIFFWFLILGNFAGISSAVFIITSNKSIWTTFTNGKDADWAVNITTAFSITNTVANIVSGFATDFLWSRFRYPRNKLLSLVLLFDAVVYVILIGLSYGVSDPTAAAQVVFVICLVSVGFCFGTFLSVVPIIVGDFYGHVNFGLYFGYIQLGATGATFIIPNVAEVIKQQMGNYNVIFIFLAVCLATSSLGVYFKRPTPIGRW